MRYAAYPAEVIDPGTDGVAVVCARGYREDVAVMDLDEPVVPGDWVLVADHVALARIAAAEAAERWRVLERFPERMA